MNIALAHDWLDTTLGGSERVFIEFTKLYPDAPIYTLLFDANRYKGLIDPRRVVTSSLQKLPKAIRSRHKYLIGRIPRAVEAFNFEGFDVVLSSSNGFIKGIKTSANTTHICYCHTPARFVWEDAAAAIAAKAGGGLKALAAKKALAKFKDWDITSAQRVDQWLANSKYTADRLKKYYGVSAKIIYPPVNVRGLSSHYTSQKGDYYLSLSTFAAYKRLDSVVEAFNQNGRLLVMAGEGPERARLERLAKPNVRFVGWVDEAAKADYLAGAKALIYPSTEDFGIAPIEALAVGTPVIAFGKGGVVETIKPTDGVLYKQPTADSLMAAVAKFEQTKFDPGSLKKHAIVYDRANFLKRIDQIMKQATA